MQKLYCFIPHLVCRRLRHNSSHCRRLAVTHSYLNFVECNSLFSRCIFFIIIIAAFNYCCFICFLFFYFFYSNVLIFWLRNCNAFDIHESYHFIPLYRSKNINKFHEKRINHLMCKVWVAGCCCWFWLNVTNCIFTKPQLRFNSFHIFNINTKRIFLWWKAHIKMIWGIKQM